MPGCLASAWEVSPGMGHRTASKALAITAIRTHQEAVGEGLVVVTDDNETGDDAGTMFQPASGHAHHAATESRHKDPTRRGGWRGSPAGFVGMQCGCLFRLLWWRWRESNPRPRTFGAGDYVRSRFRCVSYPSRRNSDLEPPGYQPSVISRRRPRRSVAASS